MSTTAPQPPQEIVTDRPGIPFGRLVRVELRKMVDTRAGFWLMASTGLLLVLILGIYLAVVSFDDNLVPTAKGAWDAAAVGLSLLLPVLAIVSVTAEWGQRTALTTFTLSPSRLRIFGAKFAAVTGVAIVTLALTYALSSGVVALGGSLSGDTVQWNMSGESLAWNIAMQLISFWVAFGFGLALLSTAGAIVAYYVVMLLLPVMVYPPVFGLVEVSRDIIPWLDITFAIEPLRNGTDYMGESVDVGVVEYLQFVTGIVLWLVLPTVYGLSKGVKSEIK